MKTTQTILKLALAGLLLSNLSACANIASSGPNMVDYSYVPQTNFPPQGAEDITVLTPGSLDDY